MMGAEYVSATRKIRNIWTIHLENVKGSNQLEDLGLNAGEY
jgi:hypothetical protein